MGNTDIHLSVVASDVTATPSDQIVREDKEVRLFNATMAEVRAGTVKPNLSKNIMHCNIMLSLDR